MFDEEISIFGSDDEDDDERRRDNPEDKKYLLRKEFRTMIYGFGDDKVTFASIADVSYVVHESIRRNVAITC